MPGLRAGLGLTFAAIVLGACGTPAVVKSVPPSNVQALPPNEKPAPVFFRKIVVDIPDNAKVGTFSAGLICASNRNLRFTSNRRSVSTGFYASVFKEEFEKANFIVVGSRTQIFKDPSPTGARFVIGGRLKALKSNVCAPNVYNLQAFRGQTYMRVEWQVFDPQTNSVVFSKVTEGSHKIDSAVEGGDRMLMSNAYRQNVRSLLADQKFRRIITGPAAGART